MILFHGKIPHLDNLYLLTGYVLRHKRYDVHRPQG
jgi:hypothetical protein